MGLHAPAIEILIEKAKLAPDVALGMAQAIDSSIMNSQFVTVPVLDARLQEVRTDIRVLEARIDAKLEKLKAELVRWVFLVMLGSVAISLSASALTNYLKSL